ncbi:MAG: 3-phosphoserine/phosphohydroxythreonine transaminase [Pirellulales bacterium]
MANEQRVFNFSAGPAVMPLPVLEQIRDEIVCLPGVGASVMEISHRSDEFIAIQEGAKQRLIRLLNIPDDYDVLFLQGGSRLQFSMIPMNLLRGQAQPAQYLITGTWGKSALEEAEKEGKVEVLWDGKSTNYDRLPKAGDYRPNPQAAYVHITNNETIQGIQFATEPDTAGAPLICDSSSDFMYRPIDIRKYGMMYACAQKNAGPAGVTVVIMKRELLDRSQANLPGYLSYKNHSKNDSMWNTPPTFAVYVLGLVAKWLEETIGGLDNMLKINMAKAKLIYDAMDRFPTVYQGHAQKADRSLMNVTFRLPDEATEKAFLGGAQAAQLDSLKGHRSVGGIRASIYNAMPMEGAQALANYMIDFAQKRG